MRRHIFGMAKSSLDLRGGKGRNLELDFLRLVYAVQHYRRMGDEAQGYLAVFGLGAGRRIAAWAKKYDAETLVIYVPCRFASAVLESLQLEKAKNVEGMIAGARGETAGRRSTASIGRIAGEQALRDAIFKRERSVSEITNATQMPFSIRWDFYGVVARKSAGR